MEAAHVLRSARRHAGMSQRELAAATGVALSVIAAVEAGRRQPTWSTVERLLEPLGLEPVVATMRSPPEEGEWWWLRLSTTTRLYGAVGGRLTPKSSDAPVWNALRRLGRGPFVLGPEASASVWLRDVPVPSPLPVRVPLFVRTEQVGEELVVERGPWAVTGLVPVGIWARHKVLVLPPDAPVMADLPGLGPRLRGVGAVLHEQMRRDEAERRTPAHRDSDPWREFDWLMARRRISATKPLPSPFDRRDWRLGGEASLRAWLALRGHALGEGPRI